MKREHVVVLSIVIASYFVGFASHALLFPQIVIQQVDMLGIAQQFQCKPYCLIDKEGLFVGDRQRRIEYILRKEAELEEKRI